MYLVIVDAQTMALCTIEAWCSCDVLFVILSVIIKWHYIVDSINCTCGWILFYHSDPCSDQKNLCATFPCIWRSGLKSRVPWRVPSNPGWLPFPLNRRKNYFSFFFIIVHTDYNKYTRICIAWNMSNKKFRPVPPLTFVLSDFIAPLICLPRPSS